MRQIFSRSDSQSLQSLHRSDNIHRIFNVLRQTLAGREAEGKTFPAMFAFESFNTAIFVKHRPRRWEQTQFSANARRRDQTKVILPIDPTDLGAGARTFLMSGSSFEHTLSTIIGPGDFHEIYGADVALLKALRDTPNFDPFFLQEKLAATGITIHERYTRLPEQTLKETTAFVFDEIKTIVQAAYPTGATPALVSQMAEKLMSDSSSVQLAPLREAFQLSEQTFIEAVYAWRGFLYYKYMNSKHRDVLSEILREIIAHHKRQRMESDEREYLTQEITKIVNEAQRQYGASLKIINGYNTAYRLMLEDGKPAAFWNFLRTARSNFMDLGLSVGVVEHFVSYWSFIRPGAKKVQYNSYSDLVIDMRDSLGI